MVSLSCMVSPKLFARSVMYNQQSIPPPSVRAENRHHPKGNHMVLSPSAHPTNQRFSTSAEPYHTHTRSASTHKTTNVHSLTHVSTPTPSSPAHAPALVHFVPSGHHDTS
eukprot:4179936-Prymnesium_polylepis.1